MDEAGSLPLSGLTVRRVSAGRPSAIAEWLLEGLGASAVPQVEGADLSGPLSRRGEPTGADLTVGGDVTPVRTAGAGYRWHGVPSATVDYALGAALGIAALASWRSGQPIGVSEVDVAVQVFLPEVMALAYASPTAMRPSSPRAAPGDGWLHADLGAGDDRERFASLLETLPPDADAPTVAAAAQEWRLAVCEYRRRAQSPAVFPISVPAAPDRMADPAAPPRVPAGSAHRSGLTDRPLDGVVVTDLTAMWAGPLATWLLQGLGATVHKVEPDVRLDGFRALDGRGIHPFGRQVAPGEDSAMWNALNHGKLREPLDLRDEMDKRRFLDLVRRSDIVIDAYSPRVMPNLGFDTLPPGPTWLSMPAFPAGPRRSWIAYGTGIHALAGLGDLGDGDVTEPLVSYPDPLAGFVAALGALAAIVGSDLGQPVARMEVPLAAATLPLAAWSAPAERIDPALSPGLPLLEGGSFHWRAVGGLDLRHPRSPFIL